MTVLAWHAACTAKDRELDGTDRSGTVSNSTEIVSNSSGNVRNTAENVRKSTESMSLSCQDMRKCARNVSNSTGNVSREDGNVSSILLFISISTGSMSRERDKGARIYQQSEYAGSKKRGRGFKESIIRALRVQIRVRNMRESTETT